MELNFNALPEIISWKAIKKMLPETPGSISLESLEMVDGSPCSLLVILNGRLIRLFGDEAKVAKLNADAGYQWFSGQIDAAREAEKKIIKQILLDNQELLISAPEETSTWSTSLENRLAVKYHEAVQGLSCEQAYESIDLGGYEVTRAAEVAAEKLLVEILEAAPQIVSDFGKPGSQVLISTLQLAIDAVKDVASRGWGVSGGYYHPKIASILEEKLEWVMNSEAEESTAAYRATSSVVCILRGQVASAFRIWSVLQADPVAFEEDLEIMYWKRVQH